MAFIGKPWGIFLLTVLGITAILATVHITQTSSNLRTVLSGPYNVPYFSTFLVPAEHFSRGGLHEAAIPYERKLRSDGIVDDDGVHYLNPLQASHLLCSQLDVLDFV